MSDTCRPSPRQPPRHGRCPTTLSTSGGPALLSRRSAPGGTADEIGQKADIRLERRLCRLAWGSGEVGAGHATRDCPVGSGRRGLLSRRIVQRWRPATAAWRPASPSWRVAASSKASTFRFDFRRRPRTGCRATSDFRSENPVGSGRRGSFCPATAGWRVGRGFSGRWLDPHADQVQANGDAT